MVLESTTYPGTTDGEVLPILRQSGLDTARDFLLAFSPEREDPGRKDHTTRTIPKIVGGVNPESTRAAEALYAAALDRVVVVSSSRVAESSKLLENVFRSVNIALVNELKVIFDRMGIDVWEVIRGGGDEAVRLHALLPGPGAGRALHPARPVLPVLEGGRVRRVGALHRAGRRDQHSACRPGWSARWPRR